MSFPKPPVPSNAAVKDSPAAPPPPAATAAPPPPAAAAAAPPAPEPVFSPAEQTDPGSDQIAPPPGFQVSTTTHTLFLLFILLKKYLFSMTMTKII